MDPYLAESKRVRALTDVHYNCAQGVLMPFAKAKGLNEEQTFALSGAFGAGMRTGRTCGAITGSLMVLGLYGLSDPQTVGEFFRTFEERHEGMTNCKDLLRTSAQRGEVKKQHYDGLVFECVEILVDMLSKRGLLDPEKI